MVKVHFTSISSKVIGGPVEAIPHDLAHIPRAGIVF